MIYVDPTEEKILTALRKSKHGLSEFHIQKETGVPKASVTTYLRELQSEGVVQRATIGPGYILARELVEDAADTDVEALYNDAADIGDDDDDLDQIIASLKDDTGSVLTATAPRRASQRPPA
jgi:predicted ArsR family transcriptional regulator